MSFLNATALPFTSDTTWLGFLADIERASSLGPDQPLKVANDSSSRFFESQLLYERDISAALKARITKLETTLEAANREINILKSLFKS